MRLRHLVVVAIVALVVVLVINVTLWTLILVWQVRATQVLAQVQRTTTEPEPPAPAPPLNSPALAPPTSLPTRTPLPIIPSRTPLLPSPTPPPIATPRPQPAAIPTDPPTQTPPPRTTPTPTEVPTETPTSALGAHPDLVITDVAVISPVAGAVEVEWVILNQGTAPAPWVHTYIAPWNQPGPLIADLAVPGVPLGPALAPGATLRWQATLPLSAGQQTLWALVDGYDWVAETNEANNLFGPVVVEVQPRGTTPGPPSLVLPRSSATPMRLPAPTRTARPASVPTPAAMPIRTVIPKPTAGHTTGDGLLPDLVVTSLVVTKPVAGAALVEWTIQNRGTASARWVRTLIYWNPPAPPVVDRAADEAPHGPSLAPGATIRGSATLPLLAGRLTLWALTDAHDWVAEADETNNLFGPVFVEIRSSDAPSAP